MTAGGANYKGGAHLREGRSTPLLLGLGSPAFLAGAGGILLLAGLDAVALLALAPWMPSLLLQDYWRRMAFRRKRADQELISDVVCRGTGVRHGRAVRLDVDSVATFIASWGIGATAGALVGLGMARSAILAEPTLRLAYGEFTGAPVITQLVAAQYVRYAIGFGCGVALKAAGQMRQLWVMRTAGAADSITGLIVLARSLGLIGAGLASGGADTVGIMVAFRRMRRRPPPVPPARSSQRWRSRSLIILPTNSATGTANRTQARIPSPITAVVLIGTPSLSGRIPT